MDKKLEDLDEDDVIWMMKLSNGETIYYGGFNRKECNDLQSFLNENSLSILDIKLKFRSHVISLPKPIDGFYLTNGALGSIYASETNLYYVYAPYDKSESRVNCLWFKIPELLEWQSSIKDLTPDVMENIIRWDFESKSK